MVENIAQNVIRRIAQIGLEETKIHPSGLIWAKGFDAPKIGS
jgi:hypothetical protein